MTQSDRDAIQEELDYTNELGFVEAFNVNDVLLLRGDVEEISHFHMVRDYTVTLKNGITIKIPAKCVKEIIAHEKLENPKGDK